MVKKYKFFDKQKVGLQQKSTNNSSIEQVLIGKVVTYAEAGCKPLSIITKRSILDDAAALDQPLIYAAHWSYGRKTTPNHFPVVVRENQDKHLKEKHEKTSNF